MTLSISNVRAVLVDRILDGATVVVEEGRIVEVRAGGPAPPTAVDGRGAFLLPGVICSHSDGVEREIWPRLNARFPVDFALRSFEGRLAAAGVTTVFHGIGWDHNPGYDRTVEQALELCDVIVARRADADPPCDHRVLHRLEARSEHGWDAFFSRLPDCERLDAVPLVSYEDHSPGQGQFRDVEKFKSAIDPSTLAPGETVESLVAARLAEAENRAGVRTATLATVTELAGSGRVRLLAHDLEDAAQVREAVGWGTAVVEFPLSRAAAEEAMRCGLPAVMGAPNVLRGGSHSGNVAAAELVAARLCTSLASDYQPSTLLAAVFKLAADGTCDLPAAVSLVSAGPAAVAGLTDRGRLDVGLRADLVLVELDGAWPRVRGLWRAGAAVPALLGDPTLTSGAP